MVIAASGMEPTKPQNKELQTMEQIIDSYKQMAIRAMNNNNSMSAEMCMSIATDIEMLKDKGYTADHKAPHLIDDQITTMCKTPDKTV